MANPKGTGLVGGNTTSISDQARKFKGEVETFKGQLGTIRGAVSGLASEFFGSGSAAYQNAMAKWDKDANIVVNDLEELSGLLGNSSLSLTQLDGDMATAFNGFGQ